MKMTEEMDVADVAGAVVVLAIEAFRERLKDPFPGEQEDWRYKVSVLDDGILELSVAYEASSCSTRIDLHHFVEGDDIKAIIDTTCHTLYMQVGALQQVVS